MNSAWLELWIPCAVIAHVFAAVWLIRAFLRPGQFKSIKDKALLLVGCSGDPGANESQKHLQVESGAHAIVQPFAKLPQAPAVGLSWYGVSCSYPGTKQRETRVLQDALGCVRPGNLGALLGPSGSGKSTLLEVLAGRKTVGTLKGHIATTTSGTGSKHIEEPKKLMQGSAASLATWRDVSAHRASVLKCSSFVPQEDAFPACLTALEVMQFWAALVLPCTHKALPDHHLHSSQASEDKPDIANQGNQPKKSGQLGRQLRGSAMRRAAVHDAMASLGLSEQKHTLVGGHLPGGLQIRGLSGGERKRLAIATGILPAPQLLLLDEPTTGLDSAAALRVMKHLRDMASKPVGGHTVLASLHQPRAAMWDLIDTVVVISTGHTLYSGPPSHMAAWLSGTLGYAYSPSRHGTAPDWAMDLVNVGFRKPKRFYSGHILETVGELQEAANQFKVHYINHCGQVKVPLRRTSASGQSVPLPNPTISAAASIAVPNQGVPKTLTPEEAATLPCREASSSREIDQHPDHIRSTEQQPPHDLMRALEQDDLDCMHACQASDTVLPPFVMRHLSQQTAESSLASATYRAPTNSPTHWSNTADQTMSTEQEACFFDPMPRSGSDLSDLSYHSMAHAASFNAAASLTNASAVSPTNAAHNIAAASSGEESSYHCNTAHGGATLHQEHMQRGGRMLGSGKAVGPNWEALETGLQEDIKSGHTEKQKEEGQEDKGCERKGDEPEEPARAGWLMQIWSLFWRELALCTRNPADVAGRTLVFVWSGLVVGAVFYALALNVHGLQSRVSCLYGQVAVIFLLPFCYISLFTSDKRLYIADVSARLYSPIAYHVAKSLVMLPFAMVNVVVFCGTVYGMAGLRRDMDGIPVVQHMVVAIVAYLLAQEVLYCAAILTPNQDLAFMGAIAWMAINILLANFPLRTTEYEMAWVTSLRYLSAMHFTFGGFMRAEYANGRNYSCAEGLGTRIVEALPKYLPNVSALKLPGVQQILRSPGENCQIDPEAVLDFFAIRWPWYSYVGALLVYLGVLHLITLGALFFARSHERR